MTTKNKLFHGLVISGTHTSVGKSSVAIGLMRLLARRGYNIQPFKAGPDYIDAAHHQRAARKPSYNLDTWICSKAYVKKLYSDLTQNGEFAMLEGTMGLFDGAYSMRNKGTSAEIAQMLNLPVLLVVDGSGQARSIAALVHGFKNFDRKIKLCGVIANRVRHPKHGLMLKEAVEHYNSVPLLGWLPEKEDLKVSSRHLGLAQATETSDLCYERWADHLETHLDINTLLKSIRIHKKKTPKKQTPSRWSLPAKPNSFKVAIARDEAFQFLYQDTLDLIEAHHGTIKFFSPIKDRELPKDIDWVYIPGGYPELYARGLAKNKSMRESIRRFGEEGGMVIAECGGLMYLGKSLCDQKGKSHNMVGLYDFTTTFESKSLHLGYRSWKPGHSGTTLKGHEFHYSDFSVNKEKPVFKMNAANGKPARPDGYRFKNCLATYTHIYWGNAPHWLKQVVKKALSTTLRR